MTIGERLQAFMAEYKLSRTQMAAILKTSPSTLNDWLREWNPRTPPACMVLVMDWLEQHEQARMWAGVYVRRKMKPRGKPFAKGNPTRYVVEAKP